ncbi:hypothetical protein O3M35_012951 [Rhynocoris fuscipes]|uniref:NADH dehydrogenase [ubiquinone] 1 alpha subcomplex subunit 11 n=1 Tax=Rhynocoris fuscipes TaxID=488301 RepID=A0AAW1CFH1_9HEMI
MVLGVLRDYLGVPRGYSYFDTPDGEDCGKKIWFVTKEALIHGPLLSAVYIMGYVRPKTYVDALVRVPYITLPLTGMGIAFAATTCMATNIRKQDDKWNYLLGGWAAAIVFGAWRRSIRNGFKAAIPLSLVPTLKKDSWQNTNDNWGARKVNPQRSFYWNVRKDLSILPDPGRKWRKSANEILP